MDDSSVGGLHGGFRAAQRKSAYVLFYTQQRDQLDSAIHAGLSTSNGTAKSANGLGGGFKPLNGQFRPPLASAGVVNGTNGKRKHDDGADAGSPPKRPMIGPQRPSSLGSLGSALPNTSSPPPPRLPQTSPQQQQLHTSSSRAPSSDDLHGKYGVPSAVKSSNFYGGPQRSHQPAPYHHQQHRPGGAQYGRRQDQRGRQGGGGFRGRGRGGGGWQSGGGRRF